MPVTIRDAMTDPALFGEQFGGDSWAAWRALFAGFDGLELDDDEAEHWKALTGRTERPTEAADELWLVVGRRGGKTNTAALRAVYDAAFKDYRHLLAPGEVATVMVLSADRRQARSCFRYISGLIDSNPMLRRMVVAENAESITLNNRTVIEVHTASFRAVRGYSVACCIADEVAFWRSSESANPDYEILNAIRPAMATLGGRLIALSSPYRKQGELWTQYQRHHSQPGPILVAHADSRTMNPALPQRVVDQAYERDPISAASEYGTAGVVQFRDDIAGFVTRALVDDNTRRSPQVIPRLPGVRHVGFVDVAGGGADEYTMAIAHMDEGRAVVNGVWAERGDPAQITATYAKILKEYGISRVTGDRFAAAWPVLEFRKHGITLDPSKLPRSGLYLELLPMLHTGTVDLPPDEKTAVQLASLERRTSRSGRDSIDHGPGGHDDRANAVAGAAWLAKQQAARRWTTPLQVTFPDQTPPNRTASRPGFPPGH